MQIFRASWETTAQLVALPESGMGFQVVAHGDEYWVAFASTFILSLSELRETSEGDETLTEVFQEDAEDNLRSLDEWHVETDIWLAFSHLDTSIQDQGVGLISPDWVAGPTPGMLASKRPISYYRYSALPRDKRVNADGDFLPGTYATTYADFKLVPSGFAAVGRYALPNPASARFLFQITTYDRPTYMGTATPNFGQAGGGVEVLFKSGAKNAPGASYMIDIG